MKVSRVAFLNKEKTTVKRALLVIATAVLFISTLAVPTVVHADGGGDGSNCSGNGPCKP
jgi:hypothetical protein